ncbi:hypothetical protein ACRS34_09455 [Stutzerimonas stutzeri]|uniref:hypothetical protein n=1 Tax=Stutzerimonas stutzeri TaxID=316 RepID=UPI003EE308BA
MSKVLVDRELLERCVDRWACCAIVETPGAEQAWLELRAVVKAAQPAEAEGDRIASGFVILDGMAFSKDEILAQRVDLCNALESLSAVTAERDRLREDRDSQQRVCIAEVEKVSQLRAEVEAMRAQRDKMAQILRDLVPGCKWRFMRPRIDQALQEVDGGN